MKINKDLIKEDFLEKIEETSSEEILSEEPTFDLTGGESTNEILAGRIRPKRSSKNKMSV